MRTIACFPPNCVYQGRDPKCPLTSTSAVRCGQTADDWSRRLGEQVKTVEPPGPGSGQILAWANTHDQCCGLAAPPGSGLLKSPTPTNLLEQIAVGRLLG